MKKKLKSLKQVLDENDHNLYQDCYWFKDKRAPGIVEDMVDQFDKLIDVEFKNRIIEYYEDNNGFAYIPAWFE